MSLNQKCSRFIKEFDKKGGNSEDRDTHYESAILWAHQKILNLDHVHEISLGDSRLKYNFLVSQKNKMALFKSTVRHTGGFEYYKS